MTDMTLEEDERDAGEIRKLRAENERLKSVLLSRHGGEPLALLEELDEERAKIDAALALHKTRMGGPFCPECRQKAGWDGYCTSPTVKALRGEE